MSDRENNTPPTRRRRRRRVIRQSPPSETQTVEPEAVEEQTPPPPPAVVSAQDTLRSAQAMDSRAAERRVTQKLHCPITYTQYQAMWSAFQEKPSPRHVAQRGNTTVEIAIQCIETGWPTLEFVPLAERLAEVRRRAREAEDMELVKAHTRTARIVQGVKVKFIEALGRGFENLKFDPKELSKLTPNGALRLAKFVDQLARTEEFVLGEDKGVGGRRSAETDGSGDGDLSTLVEQIRKNSGGRRTRTRVAIEIESDAPVMRGRRRPLPEQSDIVDEGVLYDATSGEEPVTGVKDV